MRGVLKWIANARNMSVNCISLEQGLVVWTSQHEQYSYWLPKEDSFLGADHS